MGLAISLVASRMTRNLDSPDLAASPSLWNTFSTTTTVPSTIRPIAIARPPKDTRLADRPSRFMAMKVTSGVMTMVATTTRLERTSPRKRKRMMMMKTTPSSSTLVTIHRAESTSSVRS